MTSDRAQTELGTAVRGLTVAPDGDVATYDRADMCEAAAFLMEDEIAVEAILADADVSLVREDGEAYVQRRDLRDYREREIARRRAGMREITRLSIAAGLDDVDYSAIERGRA